MVTQAQVERELRKRLSMHETCGIVARPLRLLEPEVESLTDALLPWLMELVEQVEGETREECGKLP